MLAGTEILYNKYRGLDHDQAIVDKHISDLSGKLDVYDKILSKQKYIAGDEITLADIYHIPIGSLLGGLGYNIIDSKPNVARWFKEISSRASWQAVKDGVKSTAQ